MGKGRQLHAKHRLKQNTSSARVSKRNGVFRRQHSQPASQSTKSEHAAQLDGSGQRGNAYTRMRESQPPRLKVPFSKHDCVLLVGEGDFSFALSLARHHRLRSLTATSFDSKQTLEQKYPDINTTLGTLECYAGRSEGGKSAGQDLQVDGRKREEEWNGFSPQREENSSSADAVENTEQELVRPQRVTMHYGIDATRLATVHRKTLKSSGPYSKVVFNFPHVGGISTDVNRQVRANQELLVGFFNAAKPLLVSPSNPMRSEEAATPHDIYAMNPSSDEDEAQETSIVPTTGHILVTLFEGEPYTLWNIRDLARHCGLKVIESFKFPWAAYPGYQHARTIGEITTGRDRSHEGKRKGAWRGEERDARCYVLTLKDAQGPYPAAGHGKKRKKTDDDVSD